MFSYARLRRMIKVLKNLPVLSTTFFWPHYQQANVARLRHLDSLDLPLRGKKVLEVGAGIGDHTLFYLHRSCQVTPVEGRASLCRYISERFGVKTYCIDLDQNPEKLLELGHFDILHCYGLLYHLARPDRFLDIASQVADLLILETCLSTQEDGQVAFVDEPSSDETQAIGGVGSRPSRPWVFARLQQSWPHVYCPKTQPDHPEFPTKWYPGMPIPAKFARAVFVASRTPLNQTSLVSELPQEYTL